MDEGAVGEEVVERLLGGQQVQQPQQVDGRQVARRHGGQQPRGGGDQRPRRVRAQLLPADQVVERLQRGLLHGVGGGLGQVDQVLHRVQAEQDGHGEAVPQAQVGDDEAGVLRQGLVGAGSEGDEVGARGLGHQGALVALARQVDQTLDRHHLLAGVRPGQEAHEAVEAAVAVEEGGGELGLGGERLAEVAQLGHAQLAALAQIEQRLGFLLRDLVVEVVLAQVPPAGLRLQPLVLPELLALAVRPLHNVLHRGLHFDCVSQHRNLKYITS